MTDFDKVGDKVRDEVPNSEIRILGQALSNFLSLPRLFVRHINV